jgi:hypothetical protein
MSPAAVMISFLINPFFLEYAMFIRRPILVAALLAAATLTPLSVTTVTAEEVAHFKGLPSATLSEAIDNFTRHNQQLARLLDGQLDARALYEIHQITYTLEVALEKIRQELGDTAELLEELHLATEENSSGDARAKGRAYLEKAQQAIR